MANSGLQLSIKFRRALFALIFIISSGAFFQLFAQAVNNFTIHGIVSDSAGLPVARAEIEIVADSGAAADKTFACLSDEQGKFACQIEFERGFVLRVRAQGFNSFSRNYEKTQDISGEIKITLVPESIDEQVVVTANRTDTRLGETAASVVTLSAEEIETTAAPTIDDALRQVAGFSLFRRSGSRNANPTSQGVSLRGVGASGASRSLVLFDGVPLNDAFGGWIQWNRVPTVAVERIEVLRGGASSLYGSSALSGAINILPRRVKEDFAFSAEIYGGTQRTLSGSTFFGFSRNGWSADFVAAIFQTRGYILIDEEERGAVDSFAGAKNSNLSARLAKRFGERAEIFFKSSFFGEARTNGTPAQINRTYLRQFVLGGDWQQQQDLKSQIGNLRFNGRVYGGNQVYDQTFSTVASNRNSEALNRLQRVPAQTFGFSGQLSGTFLKNQTFVAGVEAREVRGASDEIGFFGGNATTASGAGGRERTFGFFVQDLARIGSKVVLAASLRYDDWKNFRAFSSTRSLSNNQTTTVVFPDRRESAFSPQISLLYQVIENLSVFALASRSFRAPTLNELYRGFRVGNVVTLANENLRAEKASNFEAGANFSRNNFYLRGNFFLTEISQPVSNITLSVTPTLITRQRQNAGKTRAAGLEIEVQTRFSENLSFSAGYLLTDSRVADFPANPVLEGLLIPQVARHQFTFQTNYTKYDWTLALQGRASSKQFDDDLNTLRLEPYFQLDAFLAKRFRENWQIFAAVENVFNSRYSIARTPVRSVSSPVNFRLGFRWK